MPFGAYSGPSVSIVVNNSTYLNITLIVTAPDTNPSPNPNYDNTSFVSVWINVQPASQAAIDLFTNKGGVGPNVNSAAYSPQERVQMYAYVTSNKAFEPGMLVTFAVLTPNGTVFVLQGTTNSTGYAYQNFTTPWIDTANLGTWTIIASVNVAQVVVTDTLNFTCNYLITVNGITLPASVHRQASMTVNVTIKSIENVTLWPTITLFDAENVPIGSFVASSINDTVETTSVSATFTVPSWAFVGTATVYVNLLTNSPTAGGVAYCPEKTANFQLLA
jgi:hypothetical protein